MCSLLNNHKLAVRNRMLNHFGEINLCFACAQILKHRFCHGMLGNKHGAAILIGRMLVSYVPIFLDRSIISSFVETDERTENRHGHGVVGDAKAFKRLTLQPVRELRP